MPAQFFVCNIKVCIDCSSLFILIVQYLCRFQKGIRNAYFAINCDAKQNNYEFLKNMGKSILHTWNIDVTCISRDIYMIMFYKQIECKTNEQISNKLN